MPSYDQISAEVSALYAANPNMAQVVGYSEQDILQAINSLEFGDARGRAGSGSTTFGLIYFHEGQLTGADKVATDIFARGQKDLGAQWDAQIAQDYPQG